MAAIVATTTLQERTNASAAPAVSIPCFMTPTTGKRAPDLDDAEGWPEGGIGVMSSFFAFRHVRRGSSATAAAEVNSPTKPRTTEPSHAIRSNHGRAAADFTSQRDREVGDPE